jgi:hypothetical protein
MLGRLDRARQLPGRRDAGSRGLLYKNVKLVNVRAVMLQEG